METESLGAEASGLDVICAQCKGRITSTRVWVWRSPYHPRCSDIAVANLSRPAKPALSSETIDLRIARDEPARLWRATVPGIGDVGEASTLPNLLRQLAEWMPRIGDSKGLDWHGYRDTLPSCLGGKYW